MPIVLANDGDMWNCIAARFGVHFNDDLQNHVIDDNYFDDSAIVTARNPLFKSANEIFMKNVCSIAVTAPAKPALQNRANAGVIALTRYGKGPVFAVGGPWFYNEYTNGRLPTGFENDKGCGRCGAMAVKTNSPKIGNLF